MQAQNAVSTFFGIFLSTLFFPGTSSKHMVFAYVSLSVQISRAPAQRGCYVFFHGVRSMARMVEKRPGRIGAHERTNELVLFQNKSISAQVMDSSLVMKVGTRL